MTRVSELVSDERVSEVSVTRVSERERRLFTTLTNSREYAESFTVKKLPTFSVSPYSLLSSATLVTLSRISETFSGDVSSLRTTI